ncbi:MAG TPA: WGxxGxxG family protein [Candidatus Competibacteraceae bacterium]|nr:WGxxGxxG family protein [Candidatus Competibacteraceae bacterium]
MTSLKGSKLTKAAVFALGLTALPLSMPAFSQTTPPPPDRPADRPVVTTTRDHDDNRNWDWLGLIGLLGLAGLLGLRHPKHERVVTHSTSSTQRP